MARMKTEILELSNYTYCLLNMETLEDYRLVSDILQKQFGAKFIEKSFLIWAYIEKYEYQGKTFILGLGDDLDCFFRPHDESSPPEYQAWLAQLVESVAEHINSIYAGPDGAAVI